jgi:hypothetical protein
LLLLGLPESSSFSADTQPALKHECHSKTAVMLKECSPKASKHLKSFSSGFTELHAKLDEGTLLEFAIHCRQNETRSRKSTRVKAVHVQSEVSCGRLMKKACGSVTLASPHLSPRQLQQ